MMTLCHRATYSITSYLSYLNGGRLKHSCLLLVCAFSVLLFPVCPCRHSTCTISLYFVQLLYSYVRLHLLASAGDRSLSSASKVTTLWRFTSMLINYYYYYYYVILYQGKALVDQKLTKKYNYLEVHPILTGGHQ